MDENKNYNEAEEIVNAEAEAEATESIEEVEEIEEVVEEAPGEAEIVPEEPVAIKKGSKAGAIIAVVVAIVIVAAAIVTSMMDFNKYNKMGYVDISGKTVEDLASQQGISVAEFLEAYSLPQDMPGNTSESAAYYNIPLGKIAQMYGMDLETMKEQLKLGDEMTAETPWGVAEGEVLVADYVGAENLDAFKAQYGFGDEVTAETKWKEIRNIVDGAQRDLRIAAEEAAAKEAEAPEEDAPVEDEVPVEGEEIPAEGEEAPAEETETPAETETEE